MKMVILEFLTAVILSKDHFVSRIFPLRNFSLIKIGSFFLDYKKHHQGEITEMKFLEDWNNGIVGSSSEDKELKVSKKTPKN